MGTKLYFILVLMVFYPFRAFTQSGVIENRAFQRGEKLVYKVYYHSLVTGAVNAGEAVLEVTAENKLVAGKPTFHFIASGRTGWAFNFFYKVIDRFESYVDEENLLPCLFLRRIYEDGYVRDQDNVFDQKNHVAYFRDNLKHTEVKVNIPEGVHDIISSVYFLRNYDFSKHLPGEPASVQYMFGDSVYTSAVKFIAKETVKIGIGKVSCMKVQPGVLTGNVFDETYPLSIWVSDDQNRIPVLAQTDILIGSVRMELVSWEGIRNPFTGLKK